MRPAEREADLLMPPGQRRIGTIAIDLQDARKALQMRCGALGPFDKLRTGLRSAA